MCYDHAHFRSWDALCKVHIEYHVYKYEQRCQSIFLSGQGAHSTGLPDRCRAEIIAKMYKN